MKPLSILLLLSMTGSLVAAAPRVANTDDTPSVTEAVVDPAPAAPAAAPSPVIAPDTQATNPDTPADPATPDSAEVFNPTQGSGTGTVPDDSNLDDTPAAVTNDNPCPDQVVKQLAVLLSRDPVSYYTSPANIQKIAKKCGLHKPTMPKDAIDDIKGKIHDIVELFKGNPALYYDSQYDALKGMIKPDINPPKNNKKADKNAGDRLQGYLKDIADVLMGNPVLYFTMKPVDLQNIGQYVDGFTMPRRTSTRFCNYLQALKGELTDPAFGKKYTWLKKIPAETDSLCRWGQWHHGGVTDGVALQRRDHEDDAQGSSPSQDTQSAISELRSAADAISAEDYEKLASILGVVYNPEDYKEPASDETTSDTGATTPVPDAEEVPVQKRSPSILNLGGIGPSSIKAKVAQSLPNFQTSSGNTPAQQPRMSPQDNIRSWQNLWSKNFKSMRKVAPVAKAVNKKRSPVDIGAFSPRINRQFAGVSEAISTVRVVPRSEFGKKLFNKDWFKKWQWKRSAEAQRGTTRHGAGPHYKRSRLHRDRSHIHHGHHDTLMPAVRVEEK